MRTTIDLPADLHQLTSAVARSRGQTLSQTVAEILRQALISDDQPIVSTSPITGLPVVDLGRTITPDDVAALDDDG
jgi:hypothetical protein